MWSGKNIKHQKTMIKGTFSITILILDQNDALKYFSSHWKLRKFFICLHTWIKPTKFHDLVGLIQKYTIIKIPCSIVWKLLLARCNNLLRKKFLIVILCIYAFIDILLFHLLCRSNRSSFLFDSNKNFVFLLQIMTL